jgi:hypothetical protein
MRLPEMSVDRLSDSLMTFATEISDQKVFVEVRNNSRIDALSIRFAARGGHRRANGRQHPLGAKWGMPDGPTRTLSSPPIFLMMADEHMLMPGNRNHVLGEPSEAVAVCKMCQTSGRIVRKVFREQTRASIWMRTRNQQKKQNMMIRFIPKSWDLESSLAPR